MFRPTGAGSLWRPGKSALIAEVSQRRSLPRKGDIHQRLWRDFRLLNW